MFRTNTRVWIPIAAATVPGVCVADPQMDSYTNRAGATVRIQRVPVISLRQLPGREPWFQLSYEATTLLSPRETVEAGLDTDDKGSPLSLQALWAKQHDSLRAFLASRQAPVKAPPAKAAVAAKA